MKLKTPFAQAKILSPQSPDLFAELLDHQRSIMFTPEHLAFIEEKKRQKAEAAAEVSE